MKDKSWYARIETPAPATVARTGSKMGCCCFSRPAEKRSFCGVLMRFSRCNLKSLLLVVSFIGSVMFLMNFYQIQLFENTICRNCNSGNYSVRLKTPLVTEPYCTVKYDLLFIVSSPAVNFAQRKMIRKTWGSGWVNEKNLPTWKTMFLIERSSNASIRKNVLEESRTCHDLLIGDFDDKPEHLPLKTIMGLEWATLYCKFRYLCKLEDDSFVNIPNLMHFLTNRSDIEDRELYSGYVNYQTEVPREGANAIPKSVFSRKYYPRYVSSSAILMSPDVVESMVHRFDPKNYFHIEEVYLGMLALKLGFDAIHGEEFFVNGEGNYSTVCTCLGKTDVVIHPINNSECLQKIYKCHTGQEKKGSTFYLYIYFGILGLIVFLQIVVFIIL